MKNYVFIDIETNGFNTLDGDEQIIKIGARKVDKDFKKIAEFNTFVKPRTKLSYEIEKLTNITNEILETHGKDEKVSMEQLLSFINNSVLISYNATFEMSFILKAIYNNNIQDHEIYYFDILQELKALGFKEKAMSNIKEYYKINKDGYLTSLVEITKKLLEEYKCTNLEEYINERNENKIRFPGLTCRNVKLWVRFSKGNTKDNRRLIEFIDESKDRKVGFLINYDGINRKIINLDEMIEFRKMGSKTIDNIYYLNPNTVPYMDYYRIDSNIKIEKNDTWLIERLNKVVIEYLKNRKIEIICYGSIKDLRKNYSVIDSQILDKIISFIVAEI